MGIVLGIIDLTKKDGRRKELAIVAIVIGIVFPLIGAVIYGLGNKNEPADANEKTIASTEAINEAIEPSEVYTEGNHIYDNAEVVDLMNGYGTEVIGSITISKASKKDCTDDALADWYFNYVKNHLDSNYHLIVYTDEKNQGVYSSNGFIQKDIELEPDETGSSYSLGDDAGSTYYSIDETSKTISATTTMADKSTINDVKSKVDNVIPETYKNSDYYSVDIAGENGKLDCNLTLVSADLEDADYQALSNELAAKIKDLNLGIGYFNIAFQSDDFTVKALSSIDDLSSQEPTEMNVTTLNY